MKYQIEAIQTVADPAEQRRRLAREALSEALEAVDGGNTISAWYHAATAVALLGAASEPVKEQPA